MARKTKAPCRGALIIIGGHEDREGEMRILKEVARRTGDGVLVVTTVASLSSSDELWDEYQRAFRKLGVKSIRHLPISTREQSMAKAQLDVVEGAKTIFFSGGDQLRITSFLGGTPLLQCIKRIYEKGGTIAGTSAGASAVSQTMILSGASSETHRIGTRLGMASGLGFVSNTIIDQHFAERGRIGRLLGAIALNPSDLGIGIDEDTAFILEEGKSCRVLGAGGVYIVDAREATDSNVSDGTSEGALSLFNVRLHVLSDGDTFDLTHRKPEKHFPGQQEVA